MVQENGQVTLPIEFRRKYAVQKGDWIIFQETENGLLISPRQIQAVRSLDETLISPEQLDTDDEQ
jgi:bifunctional DNA-binding transcriptional regulator/antitoxin component of YhaV-PrlF toxin-antitoxin module